MSLRNGLLATLGLCALSLGCNVDLPGKPDEADRYKRPVDVLDFDTLYSENCSGCHGADGRFGPARPLNDPLFLALAGPGAIVRAATTGKAGTPMPAFALSEGGVLSDAQIKAIADGIIARWSDPKAAGSNLPPYSEKDSIAAGFAPGSDVAGAEDFRMHCGPCHGATGAGAKEAGSVVNSSYLALSSDQSLRNTVIAGRLDLGMPNFREYETAGQRVALSPQQISNIVAWLASQRAEFPGQTYPEGTTTPPMPAPKEKL
ncbi:MAG: c-type cytochrome [Myxococcota bacterium]|nr:c-type cytochrome [Myxococcota bacterium]